MRPDPDQVSEQVVLVGLGVVTGVVSVLCLVAGSPLAALVTALVGLTIGRAEWVWARPERVPDPVRTASPVVGSLLAAAGALWELTAGRDQGEAVVLLLAATAFLATAAVDHRHRRSRARANAPR